MQAHESLHYNYAALMQFPDVSFVDMTKGKVLTIGS
jgi:hypothetical protein